jgi:hypothetical protein
MQGLIFPSDVTWSRLQTSLLLLAAVQFPLGLFLRSLDAPMFAIPPLSHYHPSREKKT